MRPDVALYSKLQLRRAFVEREAVVRATQACKQACINSQYKTTMAHSFGELSMNSVVRYIVILQADYGSSENSCKQAQHYVYMLLRKSI